MDFRLIVKIAKEAGRYKSRGLVEVKPITIRDAVKPVDIHLLQLSFPRKEYENGGRGGLTLKCINYRI